MKTCFTGILSS